MTTRRPPFSRRTAWDLSANRLARLAEAARAGPAGIVDLTETNPTRCGLAWPAGLLAQALAGGDPDRYDPDPRGAAAARAAIAAYVTASGAPASPDDVLLTSSTSEAYAFLLELLCDPGDEVLVPAPSYPLLDVIAQLEAVTLVRYPLRYDGAWYVDVDALARGIGERTRAVVLIAPSNPTGAVVGVAELRAIEELCAGRGLALVGDEVFADTAAAGAASVGTCAETLAFRLAGLSKTCGLPQLKVAWMTVSGPARDAALERLEMVSDAFLSVAGPVQGAIPALLAAREVFLGPLRERLARNRATLAAARSSGAAFTPLRSAGGWSAVLQIGATLDEEVVCERLLRQGVLVQPGFFYDFERSGYLVVSLLPPPDAFAEGVARLARLL